METVIKATIIYVFLWMVLRLTGRRTVGQLSIFEFILLLIIGGATQRALTGEDYSLINAAILVITLLSLDVCMSLLERHSKLFAKITKGMPTVLVENGQPLPQRMHWARLTESEIMEAARRRHGLERLDEIKFAILETSGDISIIPADSRRKAPARKARAESKRPKQD